MWLEPTAAHCSTTGRTRSNAPSIRPAANSTASSINPSAKPQITHKSLGRGSKEDYLKAIAEAEAEGHTVIPAALAHWLSVTRPAVTFALKRLTKDGLVSIKGDGHIQLTSQGREIAERTIVRHHLIERMLSEIFGMPWYEIHDEAERLEHAVSPAFEKKLVEKLGHKDTCPHGNELVLRSPAERRKRGLRLLSESEPGSRYVVASVYEREFFVTLFPAFQSLASISVGILGCLAAPR